jgi:hypothetical protein
VSGWSVIAFVVHSSYADASVDEGYPLEAAANESCLLQASRSVATGAFVQPSNTADAEAIGEWLRAADHHGNETATGTKEKRGHYLYDLSVSLWARIAFKLCLHWQAIVFICTLAFAVVFPLVHWVFEHRSVERHMFNSHRAGAASSEAAVNESITHISINRLGGLSKVEKLIEIDRPKMRRTVKVIAHVVSISFNVFMLVQQDCALLHGAADYYNGDNHDALPGMLKRYLEFTGNISLISVRHAACVALAELIGLGAMLIWIVYRAIVFLCKRNTHEAGFDAYLALHEVFHGFNLLSGFSALRLVSVAHPALIMRQFQWNMARPFLGRTTMTNEALQFIYFMSTRCIAVFFGVLAFGVKLAFTSVQVHMPLVGAVWTQFLWRWCVVIMLLEQTLGAIGVEHVMWWRIMLIITEGGDRTITKEKIHIAHVYTARVMQAIFDKFWVTGKTIQFFVLMMTFDHVDLQYLLLDEETPEKIDSEPDDDGIAGY